MGHYLWALRQAIVYLCWASDFLSQKDALVYLERAQNEIDRAIKFVKERNGFEDEIGEENEDG